MMPDLKDAAFLLIAGFTIVSAAGVAFSRKVLYSAFSLLGTLAGAAGFFILLSSDFIAVTQVLIYVGGILILIIFAVMLTNKIGDVKLTNQVVNYKVAVPISVALAIFLISTLTSGVWVEKDAPGASPYTSMVAPIGNALLKEYLLPFEVVSIVLLGALVGAMVIVRREVK
ncbi:MAG TPA: NADH-quinone oxidoreductase subunit J [bacterium]|nr:NADH-quinone oxidoreductase subunit J [bacterium]